MGAEQVEAERPGNEDPDSECNVTRIVKPAIHLSQDLIEMGVGLGMRTPKAILRHAGRLPLLGPAETPMPEAPAGETAPLD